MFTFGKTFGTLGLRRLSHAKKGDGEMTGEHVGNYLRACRKKRGMTLAALATRLCPLPALAAIEQGQQAPSVAQLTQLYQQLGIVRHRPLPQTYPIHRLPAFSQKLQTWWQRQEYGQLVANVAAGDVLRTLTMDTDRQAVLYYYGRALAALGEWGMAQLHLRAGLMFMTPQHPQRYRSLDVLLLAAENAVSLHVQTETSFAGFERAVAVLRQDRVLDSSANLTLVYYQYAQALLTRQRPTAAIQVLQEGIAWSQRQQTAYLVPDCYVLLAFAHQLVHSRPADLTEISAT